jgi:hypothetical protein
MPVRTTALFVVALGALAPAAPSAAQGYGAPPRAGIARPDEDENLQWAASVVRVDGLRRQGDLSAKLFGTAGGDPAMNGLYTYLAFFGSSDEGWRVFRIGDFLSYRIVAETPGRLTLEVRESVMDRSSGAIGARTRRLFVSWRAVAGGEPPSSLAVTAAR